jgi:hypothetical protein
MLGRLMRRRRADDDARNEEQARDEAIIHLTVPAAVLKTRDQSAPATDMSWLDSLPQATAPEPEAPEPDATPVVKTSEEEVARKRDSAAEPVQGDEPRASAADHSGQEPNAEAPARPRFPFGWLVIVEGPGVGKWFPLERGVSHIGSAAGQTVRLDFEGDDSVAPTRHAELAFDEKRHAFQLDSNADGGVRLNGLTGRHRAVLRDGDVISVGGTSLRLVALCSPNFRWGEELLGS